MHRHLQKQKLVDRIHIASLVTTIIQIDSISIRSTSFYCNLCF